MRTITVEITELERITNCLLNFLKEQGIKTLDLQEDFYWNISSKSRYAVYEEPSNFSLGQLYDDWDSLQGLCKDKEPIAYHFIFLSSVLRYIGEVLSGELEPESRTDNIRTNTQ